MSRTWLLIVTLLSACAESDSTGTRLDSGDSDTDVYIDPGFRDANTGDTAQGDGVGDTTQDGVDTQVGQDTHGTQDTQDTQDTVSDTSDTSDPSRDTHSDTSDTPGTDSTVEPEASCALPWGGELAHGASVDTYPVAVISCGSACAAEVRRCNDGVLSGSALWPSCQSAPCAACALPWGGTLAHGQSTLGYTSGSVACGSTCSAQTRTCQDGVLSGDATFASCAPNPCTPIISFSTSFGGAPSTTFKTNQTLYGRLYHLSQNLTESCAEPLGRAAPNCRNGAAWTRLPNNDWTWDIASQEWRAVFPANTFPAVAVEMFVRHLGNGLEASQIVQFRNPCYWTAIVPGPVSPPTSVCAPPNEGQTTQYNGYTWTCACE